MSPLDNPKRSRSENHHLTNTRGLSQLHSNGSIGNANKNLLLNANEETPLTGSASVPAKSSQPKGEISSTPKSSDVRSLDKDVDDAKWYVKHYTNKLLDTKTPDEQVMFHNRLKDSRAKLDSLQPKTYSSTIGSSSSQSNASTKPTIALKN